MAEYVSVGKRTKRVDAPQKLRGIEKFVGDLRVPGLLYARPVGSEYAHAMIKSVDASAALEIPGVVAVLTGDDLPIVHPEGVAPMKTPMCFGEALYVGHFVAIVLAESDVAAQDGAQAVVVEYEPLPAVSDLSHAMDADAPRARLHGTAGVDAEAAMHNSDAAKMDDADAEVLPANVSNSAHFTRGDVKQGFAESDEIVEMHFTSKTVHQGYMEPMATLVNYDALGGLTIYTSTQALFYCRQKVAETLNIPLHSVEVKAMPVGGGFGGKFVLIEPMVAAIALAAKRPVLLQYTRMEDFLAGNPAPDCEMSVKLGAKKDGTITALESRVVFDTGVNAASPMQIGAILLGGSYRFPNMEIRGFEVMTNKAAAGSYRAPGAQQAAYAMESTIDEMARRLNLDPLEMRLKNCVVEGDPRPNGALWPKLGLKQTLEALKAHPAWQNREKSRAAGRGVGIAIGGWPGGIEPATAICRLDMDGKLTVVLGSVDLSGTNTTFAQVAAETFGMSAEDIQISTGTTATAPFAGGTGGSKITYTVSGAVQKAAEDAKRQILEIAGQHLEASVEDLEIVDGAVRVKGVPTTSMTLKQIAQMSMSFGGKYEPVYGKGSTAISHQAPGFAAHLAEVEVDELTGEVHVINYVAAQDVGFAINPAEVEGQIHGGVVQGLGWALYEGLTWDSEGQMITASLMDYALPRAEMVPNIDVVLVEVPSDHGAYGAKGIGEPCAIPGPAAVANAIRDLTGARVTNLPMTPEQVVKAMGTKSAAAAD